MNIRLASTLLNFLWQGTVIAILYSAVRRAGKTETRYLLSCGALFAMVLAPMLSAAHTPDAVWFAAAVTVRSTTNWIVLAWFIGVAVFSARLAGGWLVAQRVCTALRRPVPSEWQTVVNRLCARLQTTRPVRLVVSTFVQVPTVVGRPRPVILVPLGALTGLEPELVEALLAHELAHIRRHDYHPAVWWVSARIRAERELCCDDMAVSVCGDTLLYVRALTELESRRPWQPALAANGGSLSVRIARLLGMTQPGSISLAGPIATEILLVVAACGLSGQSTPPPAFEVASVKQNKSGSQRAPSMILPGGRFTATNNTVRALILNAYGLYASPSLLSGGPGWIDSEAYDIDARPAANAIPAGVSGKPLGDQTRLMLRTLLAARFQLSMHRETREMAIYELVVAKNGPKLKSTAADCNASVYTCHSFPGNPRRLTGTGVDMDDIAGELTSRGDRLVVDKTGIKGMFDVFLQWNPFYGRPQQPADDGGGAPGAAKEGPMPDLASLPSVFDALEQQVGLKLQAEKGPVDAWVIDHVERPTEN